MNVITKYFLTRDGERCQLPGNEHDTEEEAAAYANKLGMPGNDPRYMIEGWTMRRISITPLEGKIKKHQLDRFAELTGWTRSGQDQRLFWVPCADGVTRELDPQKSLDAMRCAELKMDAATYQRHLEILLTSYDEKASLENLGKAVSAEAPARFEAFIRAHAHE